MFPSKKIDPKELDRLFAGSRPSPALDDISGLVEKVQSKYLTEIDPDLEASHLAALIQVVSLTDKGDLAARPASKVNGPARQASGPPKRRRRFVLESMFATVSVKFALGSAAVAMAATGGLAAAGNLPDRAQTAISQAVDNVGIEIPAGRTAQAAADEARQAAEQAAASAALERAQAIARTAQDNAAAGKGPSPSPSAGIGRGVASDAIEGGALGSQISEAARAQAEERRAAGRANRPEGAGPPDQAGAAPGLGPPAESAPTGGPGRPDGAGPPSSAGPGAPGGSSPAVVPGGKPAGVPGGGRP